MNNVATKTDIQEIIQVMNEQFNRIDQRFDCVNERFDGVDQRFNAVDQRFDGVDERFDRIDNRINRLEADIGELARTTKQGFDDLEGKVEMNTQRVVRAGLMMSQGI
jgi:archaellum component FlaC